MLIIIFFRPLAQSRRLKIQLGKVWLQRRLIGVKSVEESDRISPLTTIVIIIITNLLTYVRMFADVFVKVYMLYKGRRVGRKQTRAVKCGVVGSSIAVFNEAFLFDVEPRQSLKDIAVQLHRTSSWNCTLQSPNAVTETPRYSSVGLGQGLYVHDWRDPRTVSWLRRRNAAFTCCASIPERIPGAPASVRETLHPGTASVLEGHRRGTGPRRLPPRHQGRPSRNPRRQPVRRRAVAPDADERLHRAGSTRRSWRRRGSDRRPSGCRLAPARRRLKIGTNSGITLSACFVVLFAVVVNRCCIRSSALGSFETNTGLPKKGNHNTD